MDGSKLTAYLGLKLPPELLARIRQQGERDRVTSTSNMARILIEEGLEARRLVKESESVPRVPA